MPWPVETAVWGRTDICYLHLVKAWSAMRACARGLSQGDQDLSGDIRVRLPEKAALELRSGTGQRKCVLPELREQSVQRNCGRRSKMGIGGTKAGAARTWHEALPCAAVSGPPWSVLHRSGLW